MKLQQLPVLACFFLFLLTISPEFSEAAFSIPKFRRPSWWGTRPKVGGIGSTTPAAIKKFKERMDKFQDIIDLWNEHAPGQVSSTCRHLTKIGPSKPVTVCSLSKCTKSCNLYNSYNCGVCFRTNLCWCYN